MLLNATFRPLLITFYYTEILQKFPRRKRPINRAVTLCHYASCARASRTGQPTSHKANGGFKNMRKVCATLLAGMLLNPGMRGAAPPPPAKNPKTATPIKHLVIIFQENVSFDHYFGTYPAALNSKGDRIFTPAPGTPTVNGLST